MSENEKPRSIKTDLYLNGVTAVHFYKSTWEDFDPHDPSTPVSLWYLIYRLLFMVILVAGFFQGLCSSSVMGPWYFIYLTNQTFFLQVIHSILSFLYVVYYFNKNRKLQHATASQGPQHEDLRETRTKSTTFTSPGHHESEAQSVAVSVPERDHGRQNEIDRPPLLAKIIWVLMDILQLAPYFVSAGFWIIVVREVNFVGFCQNFQNVIVHAVNSVFALVDTFIIAIPSRPIHCVFPAGYALYYSTFSGLYEVWNGSYPGDKTFIYSIIDWRAKPGGAAVASAASVFASAVGFLIFSYGLFRLREYLRKSIKGERSVSSPQPGSSQGKRSKSSTVAPEEHISSKHEKKHSKHSKHSNKSSKNVTHEV